MWVAVRVIELSSDLVFVNQIEKLHDNLILQFEAREMSHVSKDNKCVFDDQGEEPSVESRADVRSVSNFIIQIVHTLKSNLHYLRLLMSH